MKIKLFESTLNIQLSNEKCSHIKKKYLDIKKNVYILTFLYFLKKSDLWNNSKINKKIFVFIFKKKFFVLFFIKKNIKNFFLNRNRNFFYIFLIQKKKFLIFFWFRKKQNVKIKYCFIFTDSLYYLYYKVYKIFHQSNSTFQHYNHILKKSEHAIQKNN